METCDSSKIGEKTLSRLFRYHLQISTAVSHLTFRGPLEYLPSKRYTWCVNKKALTGVARRLVWKRSLPVRKIAAKGRACTWLSFAPSPDLCERKWSCVGRRLLGGRRVGGPGGGVGRYGTAHPPSFLVAVSQGDADASGLWEFGTCACLHTPCSWSAHEGEIFWCLEREE